jgi:hypothetical protein
LRGQLGVGGFDEGFLVGFQLTGQPLQLFLGGDRVERLVRRPPPVPGGRS